jgi:hypothetical protein
VCKAGLFRLYCGIADSQGIPRGQYIKTKAQAGDYQLAKQLLFEREFSSWQRADPAGDAFTI